MPSFESVQGRCLPEIANAIEGYLDRMTARGQLHTATMAKYHFKTGGKRLRALIPCWVYSALGRDPLEAVKLGAAIEMIHNATLVHDDLQDGDSVRRGHPTVWKKFGEAQAISCGDAMFQFGLDLLLDSGLESAQALRTIRRMISCTLQVIEGQAQEFLMKDEALPGMERYFGVIRGKTAALIGLPFAVALDSLGEDQATVETAERAAVDCGLVFQIQDDLLDVYGDKQRDQKATDIAEGKISFLVAHVFDQASQEDSAELMRILRTPRAETKSTEIERAVQLFDQYGARQEAQKAIDGLLHSIQVNPVIARRPQLQGFLAELVDYFLKPVSSIISSASSSAHCTKP